MHRGLGIVTLGMAAAACACGGGAPADHARSGISGSRGVAPCDARTGVFAGELAQDDRVALQLRASDRVMAVQLEGCRVHLVAGCSADGQYVYSASMPKDETVTLPDPPGASLHMMTVGSFATVARPDGKSAACARATHAVTGFTAGAYVLTASEAYQGPGGITASRKQSSKDGDLAECAKATASGAAPPPGCSSPVRLELEPLRR